MEKIKKVGVITLQGEDNFGNILQNYAVQMIIDSLGYRAYTLNNTTEQGFFQAVDNGLSFKEKLKFQYMCHYIKEKIGFQNVNDLNPVFFVRNILKLSKAKKLETVRNKRFLYNKKKYIRYAGISINVSEFNKDELKDYYAFVSGSDQVWNPYFAPVSSVNFLRFAPQHKRIAFDVSFGVDHVPEIRADIYRKWISEIPSVSVREKAGAKIVKELTGRNVEYFLDPVFALDATWWNKYACKPKKEIKKKFAIEYFLGNKTYEYARWINAYAKENHLEIIKIHDIHALQYYTINPSEFVWLIAHAFIVFTDSFHGMALSINLNTPFVVFDRNEIGQSMTSRIDSVLNMLGIKNRSFSYLKRNPFDGEIDFKIVNKKIEIERKKLYDFMKRSLEKVSEEEHIPLLAEGNHCTGCLGCFNACKYGAITINTDLEGFQYPFIDENKCVHCMSCEKVCPQNIEKNKLTIVKAYYASANNSRIRRSSSSGGVFYYLAKYFLENGGVVYGAALNDENYLQHIRIDSLDELPRLQTSKYIQSDINYIYRDVEFQLQNGKQVLFTGTPCQIGALIKFLKNNYDNLFTQDVICHGVPSPFVWNRYIEELSKSKKISSVNFRNKDKGWRNFALKIQWSNGTEYMKTLEEDPYLKAFLNDISLRPSCYNCQYKGSKRQSDITLADYWGISAIQPEKDSHDGVSLVLTQTKKGDLIFRKIADGYLSYGETDAEKALFYNKAAYISARYTSCREKFFARMMKGEFIEYIVSDLIKQTEIANHMNKIIYCGSMMKRKISKKLLGNRR